MALKELFNLEEKIHKETSSLENVKEDKPFLQKLDEFYFKPKSFEKNGILYDALGIKIFRKYCPNGGSWWTKRKGYSFIDGKSRESIQSFILLTKLYESIHSFVLFPLYVNRAIYHLINREYAPAAVYASFNILINIYPIISCRYNRNKAGQILERIDKKNSETLF